MIKPITRSLVKDLYNFISSQLGFSPFKLFLSLRYTGRYVSNLLVFIKLLRKSSPYSPKIFISPQLQNFNEEAGYTKSEYFAQDLFVAQKIFEKRPLRHVDVGSRIDGFVAHIATFMPIEVLDIRPITNEHYGIKFFKVDLMNNESCANFASSSLESVSCLHALEHFGLGRYGDSIDPNGHILGLVSIYNMMAYGGILYLSVPFSPNSSIHFNAHRCFSVQDIYQMIKLKFEINSLYGFSSISGIKDYTFTSNDNLRRDNCQLILLILRRI